MCLLCVTTSITIWLGLWFIECFVTFINASWNFLVIDLEETTRGLQCIEFACVVIVVPYLLSLSRIFAAWHVDCWDNDEVEDAAAKTHGSCRFVQRHPQPLAVNCLCSRRGLLSGSMLLFINTVSSLSLIFYLVCAYVNSWRLSWHSLFCIVGIVWTMNTLLNCVSFSNVEVLFWSKVVIDVAWAIVEVLLLSSTSWSRTSTDRSKLV